MGGSNIPPIMQAQTPSDIATLANYDQAQNPPPVGPTQDLPAAQGGPGAAAPQFPSSAPNVTGPTSPIPPTRNVNEPMPAGSWGSRVYHGVLAALGGSTSTAITAYDPTTGKAIVSNEKLQPGQQWKNIIAGAMAGLAGGAQVRGPGTAVARMGAGYQAGQQQAQQKLDRSQQLSQQEFENQQKAAMSNAQRSIMALQLARGTFDLGRAQVDATATDMDRENRVHQLVMEGGPGSEELGHFADSGAAVAAFKNDPTLHDAMAHGQIQLVPHVGTDGKIDGVQAYKVTPDWQHMTTKDDMEVSYNKKDPQTGKIVQGTFTLPAGTPLDTAIKYEMGAATQDVADHYKEVELGLQARKTTAEEHLQQEEGFRDYWEGVADKAKAAGLKMPQTPEGQVMIDAIGQGRMGATRLLQLVKSSPELLDAVLTKYPDFNAENIQGYAAQEKNFTSGKVGASLNSAGTSLKHLEKLMTLNTAASHIPGTPDYKAYMHQVHIAAEELSKFYGGGAATVAGTEKYEGDLGTIGPGRGKVIQTTVSALGDKLDEYQQTWDNAMPSPAYSPRMPGITPEATAVRARIDPDYAARIKAQQGGGGAAPAAAPAAPGAAPAAAKPAATPTPNAPTNYGAPAGMPQSAIDQIVKANGAVTNFPGGRGSYQLVNGQIVQVRPRVPNG